VIFVTAALIGALFSLSFLTIIPLLKVMMGEEGLHGWVDRKVCSWRYGVGFYVPETTDYTEGSDHDIPYYLRVTTVETGSRADEAGLRPADRIIGAGAALPDNASPNVRRSRLLEELATAFDEATVPVHVVRIGPEGSLERKLLSMHAGPKTTYMQRAQWLVSFVPRGDQSGAGKQRAVTLIICLMGVVTIVRCAARFFQGYLAEKVVQVAIARLREDLFGHTLDLPVGFFAARGGTTDTISRILGDVAGTGKGIKILLGKALREPLKAIGTILCAMAIDFRLTVVFLCGAPLAIGCAVALGRKIKKATTRSLRSIAVMLGKLGDVINALRVVKVYNHQEAEKTAYKLINRALLKQTLRVAKVQAATGPIMEVLGMIAGSAALILGVFLVVEADMLPSSFFTLLLLLGVAAESARKSSDVWNAIQEANAAAERVFAIIDEPVEPERPGAVELSPLKNKIDFKDVVFSYPGADRPALNGVNLTVRAGHNVAIVGPNGSGKTTLVNLIPRFYDTDSGKVSIDGTDVHDVTLKSLRSQIAMVTQEVVTFNDTIAANISYGRPQATKDQIVSAARRAFADEFIEPLPEGYDSVIGEQGLGLSGGQLQRIVIARAILKDPAILIFDEAMSQVDADSEAKIHSAIEEIMRHRTAFIIAHRFSTVITADVIVVMDEGRIVAEGQHEELMRSCPLYQSLYETQLITA
jgi:ABC-type multidrug transport system fused ATPase/permease subunit